MTSKKMICLKEGSGDRDKGQTLAKMGRTIRSPKGPSRRGIQIGDVGWNDHSQDMERSKPTVLF